MPFDIVLFEEFIEVLIHYTLLDKLDFYFETESQFCSTVDLIWSDAHLYMYKV